MGLLAVEFLSAALHYAHFCEKWTCFSQVYIEGKLTR